MKIKSVFDIVSSLKSLSILDESRDSLVKHNYLKKIRILMLKLLYSQKLCVKHIPQVVSTLAHAKLNKDWN